MSNITKNLILGLTLISVIVLIVFSIQLIVLNVGADEERGASLAGGGQGDEDTSVEDPLGGIDSEQDISEQPPLPLLHGTRHEFRVSNSHVLVIYVDDENILLDV